MSHHPTYFPELYQASLRAGEQAGNLPEVLSRYIAYLKMLIGVREKVVKATIYPIFLLGFGLLVTMGLLFFVLPSFAEVYQESRVELPWATQLLIDLTHSATQWLMGLLMIMGLGGVLLYSLVKAGGGKPAGLAGNLALPPGADIDLRAD